MNLSWQLKTWANHFPLSHFPELKSDNLNSSMKLQACSGSVVKNPPVNAGDTRDAGSIPRSGRSPGGANGNPLCLAWKIPWTGILAGHSPQGRKELDMTEQLSISDYKKCNTEQVPKVLYASFLIGKSIL